MGLFNDLTNRIKGIFNKNKALPETTEKTNVLSNKAYDKWNSNNKYSFTRDDGSILEIEPILNDIGHQRLEQVYNRTTKQFQAIPIFTIRSEELKRIFGPQILGHEILIDIDPNLLADPKYSHFIVNVLLNANRMEKIFNDYCGFAGSIIDDQSGNLKKCIDPGIVSTLNSTREENAKELAKQAAIRNAEENARIKANIDQAEKSGPTDERNFAGLLH